ncbi:MAG: sensor domain-containing diguanylate cyclase [Janthinobacterium lividum]
MPVPSKRVWRSLTARVIGAVALACVLLVGLDGWHVWQGRRAAIAEDQVETENLARSLAQHAHDLLQTADTAVMGLRDAVETDGLGARTVARLDRQLGGEVASFPVLHGLYVFDATGAYVVLSATPAPGHEPLNGSGRSYFQYHRTHRDRAMLLGRPVRSKLDGLWILTVSRRIDAADGSFAGVALATISIDAIQAFYATFDVGAHGAITLETTESVLVARKPADEARIGADLSHGALAVLLPPGQTGNFDYVSAVDGQRRLGSTRHVADYPLFIVVAHGFGDVLADWWSDALLHLAASLGAVTVMGLLGWWLVALIRARQAEAAQVRDSEQHYRLLAENSTDLIIHLGPDFKRLYVSPASKAMLGYDPRELVGRFASDLLRAEDQEVFSASLTKAAQDGEAPPACYRARRKDGGEIWVETTGRRMEDDRGFVITTRDITLRKTAEDQLHEANEKLQRLVLLDGLTGISNRRGFDLALEREHRRAVREDTELALLMIDVDCFKAFNDAHGHQAGDACLQAIATCLSQQMQRPADLSARYGGEEFAMLLPGTGLDGARFLTERILAAVRDLSIVRHAKEAEVVTVSVGAAVIRPRRDERSLGELLRLADAALYQAKEAGRDRVCCDDAEPRSAWPMVQTAGSPAG